MTHDTYTTRLHQCEMNVFFLFWIKVLNSCFPWFSPMLMVTFKCSKLSATNHYNQNKNVSNLVQGHNNTEQLQKKLVLALVSRNTALPVPGSCHQIN
jgi:hypothetical protein